MIPSSDLKGFLSDSTTQPLTTTPETEPSAKPELPTHEDSTCKICNVKFNILFGIKRLQCDFCGHSVCDAHSLRRREKGSAMGRICDLCEDDWLKNDLKSELVATIWALEREFDTTQRENERLKTDDLRQRLEIRQLETDLTVGRYGRQQTQETLRLKFNVEAEKGQASKKRVEDLKEMIMKISAEDQQMGKQIKALQADIEKLQASEATQSQELQLLKNQDKLLSEQLSDRLNLQDLTRLLCEECIETVELL
jgi:hypothetical protein